MQEMVGEVQNANRNCENKQKSEFVCRNIERIPVEEAMRTRKIDRTTEVGEKCRPNEGEVERSERERDDGGAKSKMIKQRGRGRLMQLQLNVNRKNERRITNKRQGYKRDYEKKLDIYLGVKMGDI